MAGKAQSRPFSHQLLDEFLEVVRAPQGIHDPKSLFENHKNH